MTHLKTYTASSQTGHVLAAVLLTDQFQNVTYRITILSVVKLVWNLVTGQGCSRFEWWERYLAL